MDPMHAKYWKTLEKTGTLHQSLIDHVFGEIVPGNSQAQQDLLSMMERYGLIARLNVPDENSQQSVQYFVPAQLTSSPESLTKACPKDGDPCPLLIHFPDGFVPHGLFPQLVSRLIRHFNEIGFTRPPTLFRNGAGFAIGAKNSHDLYLLCGKRCIKVILTAFTADMCEQGLAVRVRMLLENSLDELSRDWDWLGHMRHEFCVECRACASEKCQEHGRTSCCDQDCVHMLVCLHDGETPYRCDRVFGDASRFTVPGLRRWFNDEVGTQAGTEFVIKSGRPTVDDMSLLAREVGSLWKRLGRALGLDEPELEQLEADKTQLYERCYGVLKRWTEIQASAATYESLGRALLHATVMKRDLYLEFCVAKDES
ncbi:predicted protein [Nematostella vectensis]|uniref:Death domain-containing protein n=1 Tax=Nematostella vectensis TaxID=45351 RepID=A7RN41_NEMVE|nr:predicted protein [Nematostella vectensis]|eukprot:XP_001639065.1 predicted protein [Nematostella vectensis]